jgi:hypothetical protein
MAEPRKASTTVTILAGQALSSSGDLTAGNVAAILFPADWTDANITFQISDDDTTWYDLYDNQGHEVLRPVGPFRAVMIDPSLTQAALHVRIRSGPAANPVPQEADRDIKLVLI